MSSKKIPTRKPVLRDVLHLRMRAVASTLQFMSLSKPANNFENSGLEVVAMTVQYLNPVFSDFVMLIGTV